MTTRNAYAALFFLSVLLSGLMACKKDTVVHGRVVDRVTGEALSGVKVEWIEYEELNKPPFWYQKEHSVTSDGKGEFELFSEDLSVAITYMGRLGHVGKNLGFPLIKTNRVNDVVVSLAPLDGVLKFNIKDMAMNDTLYIAVYSPIVKQEFSWAAGYIMRSPVAINSMAHTDFVLNTPAEETVSIYWSLTPWPTTSSIILSPNSGSVYITRGDTTHFQISI